jgi:hypothetical protein
VYDGFIIAKGVSMPPVILPGEANARRVRYEEERRCVREEDPGILHQIGKDLFSKFSAGGSFRVVKQQQEGVDLVGDLVLSEAEVGGDASGTCDEIIISSDIKWDNVEGEITPYASVAESKSKASSDYHGVGFAFTDDQILASTRYHVRIPHLNSRGEIEYRVVKSAYNEELAELCRIVGIEVPSLPERDVAGKRLSEAALNITQL